MLEHPVSEALIKPEGVFRLHLQSRVMTQLLHAKIVLGFLSGHAITQSELMSIEDIKKFPWPMSMAVSGKEGVNIRSMLQ